MEKEISKNLLKDQLFNKENVKVLAQLIKNVYPKLNQAKFEKNILKKFPELELKQRFNWIRENIEQHLPPNYEETVNTIDELCGESVQAIQIS